MYHGIGRHKRAISEVCVKSGEGRLVINRKRGFLYFHNNLSFIQRVFYPLHLLKVKDLFDIHIKVKGGGLSGQSSATKLAISRALLCLDPSEKRKLKYYNLLTVSSKIKERKKYGLKKARKASQFSKR